MTINLDLPQELKDELCTEASKLNLALSEYILHILFTRPIVGSKPKTGAELVAYWQSEGIINSRSDITDTQEYARKLRYESEKRVRS